MADWTVLGICGSLRRDSYNAALLRLADRTFAGGEFVGEGLVRQLPLFDPDLDCDKLLPEAVGEFRDQASRADGVVIATPEYAHGPAGVTKNAIDWLVGSGGLVGRPTVLMSASPGQAGGMRAPGAGPSVHCHSHTPSLRSYSASPLIPSFWAAAWMRRRI